jgi:glycosyltransferase involved in cell wall biosynthesis
MRIVLVVPEEYYKVDSEVILFSEIVNYTKGLAEALYEAGHEVTVLAKAIGSLEKWNNVSYKYDGYNVVALRGVSDIDFAWEVHKWLLLNPQDVVEAHKTNYPLVIEQMIGGTPTVVRYTPGIVDCLKAGVSNISDRQLMWSEHVLETSMVDNADCVLLPEENIYLEGISFSEKGRSVEIPIGIEDVPVCSKVTSKNYVVIMLSGYDDRCNGVEFLSKIVERIDESLGINIVFSANRDDLQKYIKGLESKVTERIVWCGDSTLEGLEELYNGTMVVIIPNKLGACYYSFLKAMIHGCAVVTFDYLPTWPLWRLGGWRGVDCFSKLESVICGIRTQKHGDSNKYREFASKYIWGNLVDKYEMAYSKAISNSIQRGRVRSW